MYGQYNPYMGATPQMQQRLNYLQQQQQQMYQPTMQQPMPMTLKGRIVTGMTVTGATGDTYNISFATLLRVLPSCCVIDNNAALQVQATAAGTISNVSLSVVKMA